jgi:hypothetical protein
MIPALLTGGANAEIIFRRDVAIGKRNHLLENSLIYITKSPRDDDRRLGRKELSTVNIIVDCTVASVNGVWTPVSAVNGG